MEQLTRIPTVVQVLYTGFMLVLVPYYWTTYGPTNFLYYCDVALFLGLLSVWSHRSLPASMAAVGILVPQALWVADFLGSLAGYPLVGLTGYMFDEGIPLFARALSFFHFWLPFFLIYLVYRLGYDRRALAAWTVLAWCLIAIAYFALPEPPAPAGNPNLPVNVNYVYGLSDKEPQTWMDPRLWVAGMGLGLPLLVFLPTHVLLRQTMPVAAEPAGRNKLENFTEPCRPGDDACVR